MAKMNRMFQEADDDPKLDMGPLLDMVFILLIFFVVTTTFTRQTGVEVKTPQSASASQIEEKPLLISITREGTIHAFEKQMTEEMLKTLLKKEATRDPEIRAIIQADGEAMTGRTVEVIGWANEAGIRDVSIAAERVD